MRSGIYVRTQQGDLFQLDKEVDNCLIPRGIYIPYIIMADDVLCASGNILDLLEPLDVIYVDIEPNDGCGGIIVPRIAETLGELERIKEKIRSGSWKMVCVTTHEFVERGACRI